MKKPSSFSEKVIRVVSLARKGEVITYKEVARRAGNPKASRAAGNILKRYYGECKKHGEKTIPCHRVIRSNGEIGGYAKGEKEKRKLLKREGVVF